MDRSTIACMETTPAHAWDEDAALVSQARAGDHAAFEALVLQYERLVQAVIAQVVQDADEADDLAQETFLAAFTHLGDLDDGTRFAAWLKTIALRTCWAWVERRRSDERRRRQAARAADPVWDDPPADDEHLDAWIMAAEAAVERLSDPQCQLLFLFYVRGLPTDRIAAFAGCPVGTVKRRLHDARQVLQAELPDGPPPAGDPAASRILDALRGVLSRRVRP